MGDHTGDTIYSPSEPSPDPLDIAPNTPSPSIRKNQSNEQRRILPTLNHYLIAGCCAGALYLGLTHSPSTIDLRPERWYPASNNHTSGNRISLNELGQDGSISPDRSTRLIRDNAPKEDLAISTLSGSHPQKRISLGAKKIVRARWINSHDLILQAREGGIDELILANTTCAKTLRRLHEDEELAMAAPNGRVYMTRQLNRTESKRTPEVKVSWTIRFQELGGKTINSIVIPATITQSCATPDGTMIIDARSADIQKGMGPNTIIERQGIHIFTQPSYNLEMIIKDASYLAITDQGRLAFLQYEDKTSRFPTTLEELEFPSMGRRTVGFPSEPYNQHKRRTAGLAALIWGISLMGIYGVAVEKHIRDNKRPIRSLPVTGAARCAALIGAQTAAIYPVLTYCERYITTYNTTIPYSLPERAMQAGTLIAIVTLANSLHAYIQRLKPPKTNSFFRILRYASQGKPSGWKNDDESYLSTCICLEPFENEVALAKDRITDGDFERSRIHSYRAIEITNAEQPYPEFSTFHKLIEKIKERAERAEAESRIRTAKPAARSAISEYLQARLITKGHLKEAKEMTDQILSGAGEGIEGAQLHQAMVHTALGSERSNELWRAPLESIIATTSPEAFTRVQGGTSEVVKISAKRNPYAEKTVILKRSKDGNTLLHEHAVTAEISRAVGGINGMSSLPLAYLESRSINGTEHDISHPHLALLFIDGPTLQERARTMSKAEIETYLRDEALPKIARYHSLLRDNIYLGQTRLPTMDYNLIFDIKFARRVTDDPLEQEKIRNAGEQLAAYLSSLSRTPIHGDLHAGNIITPKTILIDPADASISHESLDISHLINDPCLRQDPSGAVILFDHYRQLRGHDPQSYRAQDAAGTAHRLCHLVGRDVAYNRPEELRPHARALLRSALALLEMGIPGIDKTSLKPIESIARRIAE